MTHVQYITSRIQQGGFHQAEAEAVPDGNIGTNTSSTRVAKSSDAIVHIARPQREPGVSNSCMEIQLCELISRGLRASWEKYLGDTEVT